VRCTRCDNAGECGALRRSGDCYEMWYPKMNRVYTTRDDIWLNRMYYRAEEPRLKGNDMMEVELEPDSLTGDEKEPVKQEDNVAQEENDEEPKNEDKSDMDTQDGNQEENYIMRRNQRTINQTWLRRRNRN
jgi:hypothetical protein